MARGRAATIVPRCSAKPIEGSCLIDESGVQTRFIAETLLPTKQGKFRFRGYKHTTDNGQSYTEPTAIISGQVEGCSEVLCRVHDACFTSEVLGSLKCDCAEQLQLAMDIIRDSPPGLIIYLQQEGRGIGLANKIAAYALQEQGLDTVDANRALGLPDDCREYSSARNILQDLGVRSIRLVTNNPRKINILRELGVTVTGRVPCIVQSQEYNVGYLAAKEERMDHMLSGAQQQQQPADGSLVGEFCYWNHDGEPCSAGLPLEADAPAAASAQLLPLDADAAAAAARRLPGAGLGGGAGRGGAAGDGDGLPLELVGAAGEGVQESARLAAAAPSSAPSSASRQHRAPSEECYVEKDFIESSSGGGGGNGFGGGGGNGSAGSGSSQRQESSGSSAADVEVADVGSDDD